MPAIIAGAVAVVKGCASIVAVVQKKERSHGGLQLLASVLLGLCVGAALLNTFPTEPFFKKFLFTFWLTRKCYEMFFLFFFINNAEGIIAAQDRHQLQEK